MSINGVWLLMRYCIIVQSLRYDAGVLISRGEVPVKKILCVLAGMLSVTAAHADYLRDVQKAVQSANTGTEAVTLWNVYRMTNDDGVPVTCGFVKGFDDTGHFVPFMYMNGGLFLNENGRPEWGQETYLESPCSHTTSPV